VLADDGGHPVEDPVVHLQVLDLVLLAPRFGRHGMQAGQGVGAVLGDDDRLALARPGLELGLQRGLRAGQVAGEGVPAVVAVEHQDVAQRVQDVLAVRGEHHVRVAHRPGRVELPRQREERLEVLP
jgi:hypothetical protein